MEEKLIIQVVGQVMVYDQGAKQWHPAGTSSGLSTVRLLHYLPNNTFRIHGQKINELKEVVLDSQITREVKYNRANEAFIQWHDSQAFWGLNFRRGSPDAESFFASVVQVLRVLNQNAAQQQSNLPNEILNNQQQQQPQQPNSAAIIQRSVQQQQIMQAPQQQTMLHQQQPQMMNHQQPQSQMLGLGPPPQLMQQQQTNQQHMLQQQQQQLHQHYMQQPQSQSQASNHNQMNHYQQQQQHQVPQQQPQQQQQHQQQQMQQQAPPVVAAPIPPPPPPPPAPPALNNCRVNGTSNNASNSVPVAPSNNNSQHSPVANNNLGVDSNANRNGGSPSQTLSLASELAKCQLRKVNLSRSDSDKESECNNNMPYAKTARAASLAYVPDNLMNDLNRKLASRRERIDQQGDGQSVSNNGGGNSVTSTNGISGDKGQESWLADLIRKEISKEITKMKAEIIDAIKTELRQR